MEENTIYNVVSLARLYKSGAAVEPVVEVRSFKTYQNARDYVRAFCHRIRDRVDSERSFHPATPEAYRFQFEVLMPQTQDVRLAYRLNGAEGEYQYTYDLRIESDYLLA